MDLNVTPVEGTPDRVTVTFTELQPAISPGQVIVFYHSDVVVVGGIIEKEIKV